MRAMLLAVVVTLGCWSPAHASYIVTFAEDGQGNVVANGSGSINTAGLSLFVLGVAISTLNPSAGAEIIGPVQDIPELVRFWRDFPGVGSFGSGPVSTPTFASGDPMGIDVTGWLLLPSTYQSGDGLSNSAVFANATIDSLGLTPGSYTANFGSGADADFYRVVVSAPAAVPEPASLALLGLGVTGVVASRRRRAA